MTAVLDIKEQELPEIDLESQYETNPCSKSEVFRRYHVMNNPVNYIDPEGLFMIWARPVPWWAFWRSPYRSIPEPNWYKWAEYNLPPHKYPPPFKPKPWKWPYPWNPEPQSPNIPEPKKPKCIDWDKWSRT